MHTEYNEIKNKYLNKLDILNKQKKDGEISPQEYRGEKLKLLEESFTELITYLAFSG